MTTYANYLAWRNERLMAANGGKLEPAPLDQYRMPPQKPNLSRGTKIRKLIR